MENSIDLHISHLENGHTSYLVLLMFRPLKRRECQIKLSSLPGSAPDKLLGQLLKFSIGKELRGLRKNYMS